MKILFTSPIFAYPAKNGPELRIENSIKALANISELYIYIRIKNEQIGEKGNKFLLLHSEYVSYIEPKITKGLCWENLIKNISPDIIWFGYGNISYDLMKYIKSITSIPIVCDTDSVWSRFILRQLDVEKDIELRNKIIKEGKKKELEELEGVKYCNITTAVSQVDAEYYRSLTKDIHRIKIFSNGIDVLRYQKQNHKDSKITSPSIYLAGTFWDKSPMEYAARWTVEEIMPILIKKYPSIKLYILGRKSLEVVGDVASDNVVILGEVESVLPFLQFIDIVLVPLHFESGTRFKILEALACKKAIVSTTLGAEGIPIHDGIDILIADEPTNFASKICLLLEDKTLSLNLGKKGFLLVKSLYDIDSLSKEALSICEDLL